MQEQLIEGDTVLAGGRYGVLVQESVCACWLVDFTWGVETVATERLVRVVSAAEMAL